MSLSSLELKEAVLSKKLSVRLEYRNLLSGRFRPHWFTVLPRMTSSVTSRHHPVLLINPDYQPGILGYSYHLYVIRIRSASSLKFHVLDSPSLYPVLCSVFLTRHPGASCDEGHYLDVLEDSDSVPLDYFTSGVYLLCVCAVLSCSAISDSLWPIGV